MPTFESRYNTSKLNYKTKHRNSYAHTRNIVLLSIYAKKNNKTITNKIVEYWKIRLFSRDNAKSYIQDNFKNLSCSKKITFSQL